MYKVICRMIIAVLQSVSLLNLLLTMPPNRSEKYDMEITEETAPTEQGTMFSQA